MKNKVLSFSENKLGRDFVIGDIHGMYDAFMMKLGEIDFDESRDRMFSLGDLVDRGGDSYSCLKLCDKPWFFACLGNHELMLYDALTGGNPYLHEINGGIWARSLEDDQIKTCIRIVDSLPIAMTIKTKSSVIGCVHAEPPRDWDNCSNPDNENVMVWGRTKIQKKQDWVCENIDHVFCGHTPVKSPQSFGNVTFIDTGACFRDGHLTVQQIGGFDNVVT